MPDLYFGVANQFLHGKAHGTMENNSLFAIVIPGVTHQREKLVHLPLLRERRQY